MFYSVLFQCGKPSRAEPTTFATESISFSLKFLSGQIYGQSFIKTVQGPIRSRPLLIYRLPSTWSQNGARKQDLSSPSDLSFCQFYVLPRVTVTSFFVYKVIRDK